MEYTFKLNVSTYDRLVDGIDTLGKQTRYKIGGGMVQKLFHETYFHENVNNEEINDEPVIYNIKII